jgi:hypothetical protein
VSAADNSWDLEDSLDDTEECDDEDDKDIMPTLDPDDCLEEDIPAKPFQRPKKQKFEKISLNLTALPQELLMQEQLEQQMLQQQIGN